MVPFKGLDARGMYRNLQPLVLASASPRRRELLSSVGLSFDVFPSEVDESILSEASPDALVREWAGEKALAVSKLQPDRWILGADTIVVLEEAIFGKPQDPKEARFMLRQLSGRTHDVMSGICLMRQDRQLVRVQTVRTMVKFKELSKNEIDAYVETGEPLDKAGAYGIQGIGACLVESVQGSYTNVVGLPLCETLEWLLEEGVIFPVLGISSE